MMLYGFAVYLSKVPTLLDDALYFHVEKHNDQATWFETIECRISEMRAPWLVHRKEGLAERGECSRVGHLMLVLRR